MDIQSTVMGHQPLLDSSHISTSNKLHPFFQKKMIVNEISCVLDVINLNDCHLIDVNKIFMIGHCNEIGKCLDFERWALLLIFIDLSAYIECRVFQCSHAIFYICGLQIKMTKHICIILYFFYITCNQISANPLFPLSHKIQPILDPQELVESSLQE